MKPIEHAKQLVIGVHLYSDGSTSWHQPDGPYRRDYQVIQYLNGQPVVYIDREKNKFPVYLQFESNIAITALGFAEQGKEIGPYTGPGHCGGCFSLVTAIPTIGETTSPLIQNDGDTPDDGYHFALWLGKTRVNIDPQIYNHGEPQEWWTKPYRLFLRLWWFVLAAVKR